MHEPAEELSMKTISSTVIVTFTALLGLCSAGQGAEKYVGHCSVVFRADSTLHAFTGDITNFALVVSCDTNAAGTALLNTRIEIAPRQLTTHDEKRDADMYKMFRSDLYPKLIAAVSNAPLAAANLIPDTPQSGPGVLPVELTFCGITRLVQARIVNPKPHAEGWEFDLLTEVSLKSFKLKPSSVLGIIRVKDKVLIEAHVTVQKPKP